MIEPAEPDALVDAAYAAILLPSFPADELIAQSTLRDGLASGRYRCVVTVDAGSQPAGIAVVEDFPDADVLLLLYLAVRPGSRGAGHGSALLVRVRDEWLPRSGRYALLAEIEHPAAHRGGPGYGDPVARLRFYARHGGRALDAPYFQPALVPGRARVHGMVLAVLAHHGDPRDTVAARPIRRFLTRNLERAEGRVGTDPSVHALWDWLDGRDRVPLLPLDDPARLPDSSRP